MIRRLFSRVLFLALLGVCGLNWMQTRDLRAQVADLEARQERQAQAQAASAARGDARAAAAPARAGWPRAVRELSRGVADLNHGLKNGLKGGAAAAQSPPVRAGWRGLRALPAEAGALRREAAALWHRAASTREGK